VLPATVGASVVALALPVFVVAGWPLGGWALAAVVWVASQALGLLLGRVSARSDSLAASGVLAFGMMFRAIAVMVVLLAVAASDGKLGLAAACVYALAYTAELGLSLVAYFGAPAS
jgi:hypothetical protein